MLNMYCFLNSTIVGFSDLFAFLQVPGYLYESCTEKD